MDQRIESFLGDVLELAGEDPDAISSRIDMARSERGTRCSFSARGVRVALADCEALFRVREPNKPG